MLLSKGGDVCPQLCSLSRWEVFDEEGFGENFPSSEWVGLLVLQPVTSSIFQCERKEPQSNDIDGQAIELDSIVPSKESVEMHIWVIWRVSAKLIPLHESYKGGAELEVVSLNCEANNEW